MCSEVWVFLTRRWHASLWDCSSLACRRIWSSLLCLPCPQKPPRSLSWFCIWCSASLPGRRHLLHQPWRWGPEDAFSSKQSKGACMVLVQQMLSWNSIFIFIYLFICRHQRTERPEPHTRLVGTQNFLKALLSQTAPSTSVCWKDISALRELPWLQFTKSTNPNQNEFYNLNSSCFF